MEGNALRMDWATLTSTTLSNRSLSRVEGNELPLFAGFTTETDGEVHHYDYIIGNPPFVGARLMTNEQKNDVLSIFGNIKNVGNLDYVSCWYKKASDLIKNTFTRCALVSTNSITQGEQTAILWKPLFAEGIQIDFAWRTFRWDSESNQKAHVHCVIVGFSCRPADGPSAMLPDWHCRGYLPHRENKSLQFITYRLYDSVPAHVVKQWKTELKITETTNPNDPKVQKLRKNIAKYEDAGYGQCFMKNDDVAQIIQENLMHFNGERYWVHNWCIMPNHVHILIEVKEGWSLSTIMHSWRSYTAKAANKVLGRTGEFWQDEYFDRYIRDEEHYRNVMNYIDNNPVKAGLKDWKWCQAMVDNKSSENIGNQSVLADSATISQSQASRLRPDKQRRIFHADGTVTNAKNINAYLIDAPNVFAESRQHPINDVPEIGIGNKPIDGGNYLFTDDEKTEFLKKEPKAEKYFRKWLGADEFINGWHRWCLWLGDCSPAEIRQMPECMKRVENVRQARLSSTSAPTRKLADTPTHFHVENMPKGNFIIIPKVSSEKRAYIPMGFPTPDTFASDLVFIIPNATLYHFGVLTSSVHMAWMRAVCGRLKSDYRYSKDIVYNNFVWPSVTETDQSKIEQTAQAILDARALYPDSSLADLYDATLMPIELRRAHRANDEAVLAAYRWPKDLQESEIVERLFSLYEAMTKPRP
ncbi:MAG: transposase [Muribaculaceae bacterium]|nr:transposase [Muribaculaceae bacterium]